MLENQLNAVHECGNKPTRGLQRYAVALAGSVLAALLMTCVPVARAASAAAVPLATTAPAAAPAAANASSSQRAAPGATASATPAAAEAYFAPLREYGHTLSNSGKYMAYVRFEISQFFFFIVDVDKKTVIRRMPAGVTAPYALQWLGETRLVYGAGGQLMSVDADGTDPHFLLRMFEEKDDLSYTDAFRAARVWTIESTDLTDPETILVRGMDIEGHQSLYRLNVFTGEKTTLLDGADENVTAWVVSPLGNASVAVRMRKNGKVQHYLFANGDDEPLQFAGYDLDFDAKSFLNRRAYLITRTDNRNAVLIGENINADRFRLVRLNLSTQKAEVLHEDPNYDVGTPMAPAEPVIDRTRRTLAGVRYLAQRETTVWFDPELAALQKRIDANYADRVNRIVDWSADRSRLIVFSSSARFGGAFLVYMAKEDRWIRHSVQYPDLIEDNLTPAQDVKYAARDGQSIAALLYVPTGAAGPKPMVVIPHGGPFARDTGEYDGFVQYLVAKGYSVLQPQFRGSIGYGRAHLLAGRAALTEVMIDDIADGARAMIQRGIADPKRMFILGFSYGGYAAVQSLLRYPDLYMAGVGYGAPTDIDQLLEDYEDAKQDFAVEFWREMALGDDQSTRRLRAISPLHNVQQIKRPLLLIQGEDDRIVPVDQARRFEKAAKGNAQVRVVILKDESHNLELRSNRIYVAEKAHELFQAARPTASAAPAGANAPAAGVAGR